MQYHLLLLWSELFGAKNEFLQTYKIGNIYISVVVDIGVCRDSRIICDHFKYCFSQRDKVEHVDRAVAVDIAGQL